jgi:hypothetical protein
MRCPVVTSTIEGKANGHLAGQRISFLEQNDGDELNQPK